MAADAAGPADVAEWGVGSQVTLRTSQNDELVSGSVFAYDKPSNMLVLKETGAHSGVNNIRMIKASCIKQVVSIEKPSQQVDLRLPFVDVERCRKREEKAIQQAEVDASRVGVGVTKEAQAIFDALVKTMPCVWKDRTIVVLQCVHVEEPYTPESVTSDEDHKSTRSRVQLVLRNERERLKRQAAAA